MSRTWGPNYGHIAEVRPGGTTGWGTPEQALTNNGTSASVVSPGAWTSATLVVKDFRMALPSDAGLGGIVVEVRRDAGWILDKHGNGADIRDMSVRLVMNDIIVGENKANTSLSWLQSTPAVCLYGGPTDHWQTSLELDKLNAANFGVAFSVNNSVSNMFAVNAFVDFIRVTIYEGGRPLWIANPLGHLISTPRGPLGV